jgi:competence protein ComFB
MDIYDQQDIEVLQNRTVDHALPIIERMMKQRKDVCTCRDCRRDIAAIVLNKLPARYIICEQHAGQLRDFPSEEEVSSIVEEAFQTIKRHPHHF